MNYDCAIFCVTAELWHICNKAHGAQYISICCTGPHMATSTSDITLSQINLLKPAGYVMHQNA